MSNLFQCHLHFSVAFSNGYAASATEPDDMAELLDLLQPLTK